MPLRRFDNPREIIRGGYIGTAIASIFNFAGRRWLSGVMSEDLLDGIAGMLHGIGFGLLGLGIWRHSRAITSGRRHSSH